MPAPEIPEELFAAFFRDLAIAWRALAAYPPGHPNVAAGLAKGTASLHRLLDATGPLELAAARDGLLYGDHRFAAPAPARLAELLRRRGAAVLRLAPGVTAAELERLLASLALDARRSRRAPSLATELEEAALEHVSVTDLDFSTVVITEGDELRDAQEEVWNRLVRRLLESGALPTPELDAWLGGGGTAADLVRALLGLVDSDARKRGAGDLAAALRAAISDYVEHTAPEGLRLLGEVAERLDPRGRERLARELENELTASLGGRRTLATFFATLPEEQREPLRQLLAPATGSPSTAAAPPAKEHLARLRRAFAAIDVDALSEEGEREVDAALLLELTAESGGPPVEPSVNLADALAPSIEARTSALLEIAENEDLPANARPLLMQRVELGYRELLAAGRLRPAIESVERIQRLAARDGTAAAEFRRTLERFGSRDSVIALARGLVELSDSGVELARLLIERLGASAARHLLGVLAESDDRQLRHRLLDLLASLGPLVVRDATHLLSDGRWYVVRNVLLLLRRVGDPGSVPAVRRCAEHPDLRVRLEAIRNLFAFDQELPRELLRQTLGHPDPRLAREAIDLAAEHKMVEAAEPLADLLARWDPFGRRREVRLRAIRALASIGDPSVLPRLERYAARWTLRPVAEPERVAFFQSLASYPPDAWPRWIARGKRSRSDAVRRAAAKLELRLGAER